MKNERGSALVLVMLLLVLFMALGMAILSAALVENAVGTNDEWFEGALYAAEAGVATGVVQVGGDIDDSIAAIPSSRLDERYTFRSGGRADATPQPLTYRGAGRSSGYSSGLGTGYNPSGYLFMQYQVNATGSAPRNIDREVESLVEYGPVGN